MMTFMASRPRMVQGGGSGGGTGVGPQAWVQSWQEQDPEPSSRPSVQANVRLFMGFMPAVGVSVEKGQAPRVNSGGMRGGSG